MSRSSRSRPERQICVSFRCEGCFLTTGEDNSMLHVATATYERDARFKRSEFRCAGCGGTNYLYFTDVDPVLISAS